MVVDRIFEECRQERLHPEAYGINRLDFQWNLFGTLTFPDPLPHKRRCKKFLQLVRFIASSQQIHYHAPFWVLRHERGTCGDPHLHFVLAGLKDTPSISFCKRIQLEWEKITGGMARIALYDWNKEGFLYIFKRDVRQDHQFPTVGWDSSKEVEPSHSIKELIKGI